jgi:hypothetical protein
MEYEIVDEMPGRKRESWGDVMDALRNGQIIRIPIKHRTTEGLRATIIGTAKRHGIRIRTSSVDDSLYVALVDGGEQ